MRDGMLLNRYTNLLSGLNTFGDASGIPCNNVENSVDVGMGKMVISAPLEVEEEIWVGGRTRLASRLRKGLQIANAGCGLFGARFSVRNCDVV